MSIFYHPRPQFPSFCASPVCLSGRHFISLSFSLPLLSPLLFAIQDSFTYFQHSILLQRDHSQLSLSSRSFLYSNCPHSLLPDCDKLLTMGQSSWSQVLLSLGNSLRLWFLYPTDKCNHSMCVLFLLTYVTQPGTLQVHPFIRKVLDFIFPGGCVVFHSVDVPWLLYPVICSWLLGLFPDSGYYE